MKSLFYEKNFIYKPHNSKFRFSVEDQFTVSFPKMKHLIEDWRTACLYIAKGIKEKTQKTILIFLSGGIDSSAVALCLNEVSANFQPVVLKFYGDLNKHDIDQAFSTCHQINKDPKIIKIDPVKEWKSKGLEFANKFQCFSPQFILFMIACEMLDGFFVFGGGDPYFEWDKNKKMWFLEEEERFYSIEKYFLKRKADFCTSFFSLNSEIVASQIKDPLTTSFLKAKGSYFDFMDYKSHLYNKHFHLSIRKKHTGFENLEKEDQYYRKLFSLNPLNRNQIFRIPLHSFIFPYETVPFS